MFKNIHIVYGTETNNSKDVSFELFRIFEKKYKTKISNFSNINNLNKDEIYIFVVSTTGQGDPPSNMKHFWNKIMRKTAEELPEIHFTVFGLGDSSYPDYNLVGRVLHQRLLQLKATCVHQLGLGDDAHEFGFDGELDPWMELLCENLLTLSIQKTDQLSSDSRIPTPIYEILWLSNQRSDPDAKVKDDLVEGKVVADVQMTNKDDLHHVRHLRLSSILKYKTGDILELYPTIPQTIVDEFLIDCNLKSVSKRCVLIKPIKNGMESAFPEGPILVEDIFKKYLEITGIATRYFCAYLSNFTTDDEWHRPKLEELGSKSLEGKMSYYEYIKDEKRSFQEILHDFTSARPPLEHLISMIPEIHSRQYSIASCPDWFNPTIKDLDIFCIRGYIHQ
eukprot:GHVL01024261.1.p1 GENE.GHVL01024261.1~~GHVL01024261.1.p1  ORF type:complete len:392 (-),score=73.51 GHVL01024261.1:867-2042(-)